MDKLRQDADKIWERCKKYFSVSDLKGKTKEEIAQEIKLLLDKLPDVPSRAGGGQQLIDAGFHKIMAEKLAVTPTIARPRIEPSFSLPGYYEQKQQKTKILVKGRQRNYKTENTAITIKPRKEKPTIYVFKLLKQKTKAGTRRKRLLTWRTF